MPSNTKHVFLRLSSITSWLELKITSITLPTAKGTDKLIPLDKNKSVTPAAIRKIYEWLCFPSKTVILDAPANLYFSGLAIPRSLLNSLTWFLGILGFALFADCAVLWKRRTRKLLIRLTSCRRGKMNFRPTLMRVFICLGNDEQTRRVTKAILLKNSWDSARYTPHATCFDPTKVVSKQHLRSRISIRLDMIFEKWPDKISGSWLGEKRGLLKMISSNF